MERMQATEIFDANDKLLGWCMLDIPYQARLQGDGVWRFPLRAPDVLHYMDRESSVTSVEHVTLKYCEVLFARKGYGERPQEAVRVYWRAVGPLPAMLWQADGFIKNEGQLGR